MKEQRKGQLQEDAQDFALANTDSCHLQRKKDNVTWFAFYLHGSKQHSLGK